MQDRPRVWLLGVLLALPLAGLILSSPSRASTWSGSTIRRTSSSCSVVALINVALALVASKAAHRRATRACSWSRSR